TELSDPRFEVDGLRSATVSSPALGRRGDCTFWAPADAAGPLPLVILLHGVYGSHWAWAQKAGAHRIAASLIDAGDLPPVALAMPSDGLFGLGSGYVSHAAGDFRSWILDEIPELAAMALPGVSPESPLALAGLSMGGFGALLLGARNGARVRAVAGMSSITDFAQMRYFVGDISGYDVADEDRSVLEAIRSNRGSLPALHFDCGETDPLIEPNRALHTALEADDIPHSYVEYEGGHEWPYWEAHLGAALQFVAQSL
ncbi:MAG: alpha/beta hydrolase-fold protein, partial [Acidimicrobiales bacterium]|nr:alpha/beta hydrolase-fold protein [Acidimicrobiales bacterium]